MLHLVNKLQLEATCTDEAQAFETRHQFAKSCQVQVAEVIDRVCSKYVSEDEWIQIDRIEIDLGDFNIQTFETIFTEKFLFHFEKALAGRLKDIPKEKRLSSQKHSRLALLIYFLEYGFLPWWGEETSVDIDQACIEVLKDQEKEFIHFLFINKLNTAIWHRIAFQLDIELREKILYLFPELIAIEKKIVEWRDGTADPAVSVVREILNQKDGNTIIRQFVLYDAPVFFSKPGANDPVELIKIYIKEMMPFISMSEISATGLAEAQVMKEDNLKADAEMSSKETTDQDQSFKKNKEETRDIEEIEKLNIRHAGIVILAPFFKPFFKTLELLEDNEWKDAASHYKAIHLLRYLSTGEEMVPEYSLVLEKLLCGMELTAPIPREVVLTEKEKEEAESLLQSVIEHWKALKNTSVNGLRETFLKRDGIITKKENGWLLQVEKTTPDILMESLPWSFSSIRLPWNDYVINVEW